MKVAICISTYDRPEGLKRLLDAIAELHFDDELIVVVVDNHPDMAGKAIADAMASEYRWPIVTDVEERRGIPYVRNKTVQRALESSPDYVAMLDDDEWPEKYWLAALLRVMQSAGADVVGGPVEPVFSECPVMSWYEVAKEYYGADQHLEDGALCRLYASGNFIAKSSCLANMMPEPFDSDFAATGGEDNEFFHVLEENGCKMAWSAKGRVYEEVPEARTTLDWLKERVVSDSNINVLIRRRHENGIPYSLERGLKTFALYVLGSCRYLLSRAGSNRRVAAQMMLWKAKGRMIGHRGQFKVYGGHGGG